MAKENTILNAKTNSVSINRNGIQSLRYTLQTEDEVVGLLKGSPALYGSYQRLNDIWKQRFLGFCQGKKSLPLTYDPFFKRIFHPDIHPNRLSRLISSILRITVKVLRVLPNEDSMLIGETSLIMDLLGELEDGSLVNIEIQKQGYAFPAERISCYSSDLIMRQYARVRGAKGSEFTYRDIKKVYVIVIFEKSIKEFHKDSKSYLHHGKTIFDTGLDIEFLQEYVLIALDVFKKFPYPKDGNEQTAWLSLLATENLKDAEKLISEYPWLQEIYEEIAMLRHRPEEVLGMFSEALRILDQNTMKYMIEELQKELQEKDAIIRRVKEEKDAIIKNAEEEKTIIKRTEERKNAELAAVKKELEELKRQLKEYTETTSEHTKP